MSRYLYTYICILLTFLLSSCGKVDLPEGESESGNGQSSISADLPKFSVAEAQMQADESHIVVTGYVVGYIKLGANTVNGAVFGVPEEGENTNVLIADDAAETDVSKVFPVMLEKSSDIRAALNLFAHHENLHRRISIEGKVEKYFSVKGMKKVYGFVWESDVPAPDPGGDGGGSEPVPDPDPGSGGDSDPSIPTPGISDTPTDIPEGR